MIEKTRRAAGQRGLDKKGVLSILMIMKKSLVAASFFMIMLHTFCSEAPIVDFPEPTDRIVLTEFFTADF